MGHAVVADARLAQVELPQLLHAREVSRAHRRRRTCPRRINCRIFTSGARCRTPSSEIGTRIRSTSSRSVSCSEHRQAVVREHRILGREAAQLLQILQMRDASIRDRRAPQLERHQARHVAQLGQPRVADLRAAQIQQPQLLGLLQMRQARIGDPRVEQRQMRQIRQLRQVDHAVVGHFDRTLQREILEALERGAASRVPRR